MTNQEAKFILASYRPSGIDANDPLFAAALKQAQSDPSLAAWLEREQAHAVAVAAKLNQITPPADLREKILAGGRLSGAPVRQRKSAVWLPLMAAAVVVLGVSIYWLQGRAAVGAPLVEVAMADLADNPEHGGHGGVPGALEATLFDASKPLNQPLPIDFARLEKNGCRTLTVSGRPVLEICFQRNGTWFHCYIARAADFPRTDTALPQFASRGTIDAVAWADGVHRVIVATTAGRSALERLL